MDLYPDDKLAAATNVGEARLLGTAPSATSPAGESQRQASERRACRLLAVLGAGTMGRGIALAAIRAGLGVVMVDRSDAELDAARVWVEARLQHDTERGRISRDERDLILGRLRRGESVREGCRGCDAAIEAVFEDLQVKADVLAAAIAAAPINSLIATNTSALSVTEIAAAAGDSTRVVGMHFFNPAARMQLVEVIRGLETREDAIDGAGRLARALGKTPIVVRESPGFAVSRVNALIGNEAFSMLMEGVATAKDIDTALKLGLNHPMGPFELGDLVGWDVRLRVLEHLHQTLGERFRPCPLLRQYVAAGRLGRKTGAGVFEYREGAEHDARD